MRVVIGDKIVDLRQIEIGVIDIESEEQVRDYSYVAPELVVKVEPDPNNVGKYRPIDR